MYQLPFFSFWAVKTSQGYPVYDQKEDFDPSLERLNSISAATAYCDSLYNEKPGKEDGASFEQEYSNIVYTVICKRFYHGYSNYDNRTNFMAVWTKKITPYYLLKAVVIPDDILHYPFAACSQQCIVMMELLKKKGITTRAVLFDGKESGHFCMETFFNGAWHLFDPDMEPDMAVLDKYGQPSIAFLANHPDIFYQAYRAYPKGKMKDLLDNRGYTEANVFPAPHLYLFQQVTKFLSYTIWMFFFLAFILVRKKYHHPDFRTRLQNKNIYFCHYSQIGFDNVVSSMQ
jgi:hypothetical protein